MWGWLISVVAAAAGIPGTTSGLEIFRSITASAEVASASVAIGPSEVNGFRGEFPRQPLPTFSPIKTIGDWTEEEIIATIGAAAIEFGLSPDYLESVAMCESTFNPLAFHSYGYHGLFQFDLVTWSEFGYGYIYEPEAQARTAAMLLARGEHSRWPNCS